MKNKSYLLLLPLLLITGCNPAGGSENEETAIDIALKAVRKNNYEVEISEVLSVRYPEDPYAVDIYNEYSFEFGYYYTDTEKAHSQKVTYFFADYVGKTEELNVNTITTSTSDRNLYFKDFDTGFAYSEKIGVDNEVVVTTPSVYDSESMIYSPILFDEEFKNPFDYITSRDFVENEDGTLSLINSKADFLAECYQAIGLNKVDENYIHLDEQGRPNYMEFVMQPLVGDRFIRTTHYVVEFVNYDCELSHVQPFTHENPELQAAFDDLKGRKNFTYAKDYVTESGSIIDHIVGYFTEDIVFFHHHDKPEDTTPYRGGDDYDYKAVKQPDGTYLGYQYDYISDNVYQWNVIMLSSTSPYIMYTYDEIAPTYHMLNASIFKKTGEYTYEIEEPLLKEIGQYFDFGMYGVDSMTLESYTNKCIVTLNPNGGIEKVETGFFFENRYTYINYYISNVGTTVIPSWINA